MLVHLGLASHAETIRNAWMKTLEDGVHTGDIRGQGTGERIVGTAEFADAVIERLGQKPEHLRPETYEPRSIQVSLSEVPRAKKNLVGTDIFLDWSAEGRDPNRLGAQVLELVGDAVRLEMISNRGVKVFPDGLPETFKTDHWRCRFYATSETVDIAEVLALAQRMSAAGLDVIKVENLYDFDGVRGYSLGQGE